MDRAEEEQMRNECAEEGTKRRLEELGQHLMSTIDDALSKASIHGLDKLRKRVSAELDFLRDVLQPPHNSINAFSPKDRARAAAKLSSTNLPHLKELVRRAQDQRQHVTAVLSKMRARTATGRVREAVVDVVAYRGKQWIKITARKPLALQHIWEGRASFSKRSIIDQVKELQELALLCPVGSAFPSVTVVFAAGVTAPMADHLEGMGVSVEGDVVSYVAAHGPGDEDSASDAEFREESSIQRKEDQRHYDAKEPYVQGDNDADGDDRSRSSACVSCSQGVQQQEQQQQQQQRQQKPGDRASGSMDDQVWTAYQSACAACANADVYKQMKRFLEMCTRPRIELPGQLVDNRDANDNNSNRNGTQGGQHAKHAGHQTNKGAEASEIQHCVDRRVSDPAPCINLDVSSLVLLSSDVSYGLTAPSQLCDPLLAAMAEEEEANPALPRVLHALWGRHLIVCQTAFDGFHSIVNTIAGPREKQRAKALLERCCIMDDLSSPTLDRLPLSGKVKPRTKTIFNLGAALGIPTLTANSAFLRSANQYGVHVLVEVHAGRALTETQVDRWIRCGKLPRVNVAYYHLRARELEAARQQEEVEEKRKEKKQEEDEAGEQEQDQDQETGQ